MTEAEPVQPAADRGTRNLHAVLIAQFPHQIVQSEISLTGQTSASPVVKRPEFAPAAIALRLRGQRSSYAFQKDHIVDEFERNPEVRGDRTMRVPLLDKCNNALPQRKWMWFAHQ
jgi:hypothetical protein